jgi:RND family efflux transporter MFP subunit
MENNMIKKILPLALLLLFLISCGGPGRGNEAAVNYRQKAREIRSLTSTLPEDIGDDDARRYLTKLQKMMTALESEKAREDLRVVPVNSQTVSRGYIAEKVQYLGDITGDPSVAVYPKISDIFTEIRVENGDRVNKGDILARIDDASVRNSKQQAEAGYRSARSQLANVRAEYERMKKLYENNAVSQSQWDQLTTQLEVAEAGLEQAKASLEMAKTQLSYTVLRSPISGYVSGVAYDTGDMATPQKPFATVHRIGKVKININVTEEDMARLRKGQRSEILVSAYPDTVFSGHITTVSPVIDPMTRTAAVEVKADNPDLLLKPGMFVRVAVIVSERDNAITIPKLAVDQRTVLKRTGDGLRSDRVVKAYSCFIVENGKAREMPLEIGIESKTQYEILSGLRTGDQLVVMGQNNLSDSTLVEIIK